MTLSYDPSGTGSYRHGLFGIPSNYKSAMIAILPVPWEVTTSYGGGTARGPQAVLEASAQLDLFSQANDVDYESGFHLLPIEEKWLTLNDQFKIRAQHLRQELEDTGELGPAAQKVLAEINGACAQLAEWSHQVARTAIQDGKIPAVLGGDHSTPLGNMRAVCEAHRGELGLLHLDAHADLRASYQGFTHSHASIMNNVMESPWKPKKLVQIGIRDYCQEEYNFIKGRSDICTFFDRDLNAQLFQGTPWHSLCEKIVHELPAKFYFSIDIDGLSPEFCPHTGTPVPGGLNFSQLEYLFSLLKKSQRQLVGFDLVEVAPGANDATQYDGNVGARILYKLCGLAAFSSK